MARRIRHLDYSVTVAYEDEDPEELVRSLTYPMAMAAAQAYIDDPRPRYAATTVAVRNRNHALWSRFLAATHDAMTGAPLEATLEPSN